MAFRVRKLKTIGAGFAALLVALAVLLPRTSWAEEFKLPTAEELATLPPVALEFYANGIKALDHIDYDRAYEYLAKAAALQPRAVRLNMIVAALALKHGRAKKADEARDYYDTAIQCYENILATPALEPAFRRDVENRLKVARDEKDNLAQRDAQREGRGNMFIKAFNREMAKATKTPARPSTGAAPQPPSLAGSAVLAPVGGPGAVLSGVGAPTYPGAAPTPMPAAGPAGMPGQAGTAPVAAPGGMPALPPLQGAPVAPAPGAPLAPAPGGPPPGEPIAI